MSGRRRICFVLLAAALILQVAAPAAFAQPANVIFVKHNATGANDGTSWANAFTSLDAALESATPGKEIWVAQGTYRPTSNHGISPSDPRWAHFRLKNGVAVYGGFTGTETTRTARDPVAHPVFLSGDIGVAGDDSDNCYHVFYHANQPMDNSALLDGVTITLGRATGYPHYDGAGMYNYSSSPMLRNVIFEDNKATQNGAGIYNFMSGGLVLQDVTFRRNHAGQAGGGIYNTDGSPKMVNVSFMGNYGGEGGGLYSAAGAPVLVNALFSCNRAAYGGAAHIAGYEPGTGAYPKLINATIVKNYAQYGGGLHLVNTAPVITNCIIWDNDALLTGDQIHAFSSGSPVMTYSVCQGGWTGTGNLNSNPLFVRNPDWRVLESATDDDYGDLRLQSTSPCINAGTNSPYGAGGPAAGVTVDLAGNVRIVGTAVDMGAYEYSATGPNPPGPTPTTGAGSGFFSPGILNLKSRGGWVKLHLKLPDGHDPRQVSMSSVALLVRGQTILGKSSMLYGGGSKGIPGIKVDFSRAAIVDALDGMTGKVEVTVKWTSGSTTYTMPAVLDVINPGNGGRPF